MSRDTTKDTTVDYKKLYETAKKENEHLEREFKKINSRKNLWHEKAKKYSSEKKLLKLENRDLRKSRIKWRDAYKALKAQSILPSGRSQQEGESLSRGVCAKGYHYPVLIVYLSVLLQSYGTMSLRGSEHAIRCFYQVLGLEGMPVPDYSTIRLWACKLGFHRVKNRVYSPDSEWILFVDESISYGSEKILLVLGLDLSSYEFSRPLQYSDMEVLSVDVRTSWTGEEIGKVLENISTQTKVRYIVSDSGSNLKKSYRLGEYTHVNDCTHFIAGILKKLYNKDVDFEGFCKKASPLRAGFSKSESKGVYMPPKQNHKLRFANITALVEWGTLCLSQYDTFPSEIQEKLSFIKEYEVLLKELMPICQAYKLINKELKTHGFSAESKCNIDKYLKILAAKNKVGNVSKQQLDNEQVLEGDNTLKSEETMSNTEIFIAKVSNYLDDLKQDAIKLEVKELVCCSDIIESIFGKFKQKINPKCNHHMSEFVFTLANFTGVFSKQDIREALESISINDLILWKNQTHQNDSIAKQKQEMKKKEKEKNPSN